MKRNLTLQFYRDKAGEWRWRASKNGRILADSGEGYKRLAGAVRGWNSVAKYEARILNGRAVAYWGDGPVFTVECEPKREAKR